jgi:hypothetical protein
MPEVQRVHYDSDGHEISGILYSDPEVDVEDGDHPLVVAIHGGPVSYDEPVFSFDHAALTSRGYVVFRPNYRGGSSYGRDFCEAFVESPDGGQHDDESLGTGEGAIVGLVIGAAIGGVPAVIVSPVWIVVGMIIGAMVGDELEKMGKRSAIAER